MEIFLGVVTYLMGLLSFQSSPKSLELSKKTAITDKLEKFEDAYGTSEEFIRFHSDDQEDDDGMGNWTVGACLHQGNDFSNVKIMRIAKLSELGPDLSLRRDILNIQSDLIIKEEGKSVLIFFFKASAIKHEHYMLDFLRKKRVKYYIGDSLEIDPQIHASGLNSMDDLNDLDGVLNCPILASDGKNKIVQYSLVLVADNYDCFNPDYDSSREVIIEFLDDHKIVRNMLKKNNHPYWGIASGKYLSFTPHNLVFGLLASAIIDHKKHIVFERTKRSLYFGFRIRCDLKLLIKWLSWIPLDIVHLFLIYKDQDEPDSRIREVYIFFLPFPDVKLCEKIYKFAKDHGTTFNYFPRIRDEVSSLAKEQYLVWLDIAPKASLPVDKNDLIDMLSTPFSPYVGGMMIISAKTPDKTKKYMLFIVLIKVKSEFSWRAFIEALVMADASKFSYKYLKAFLNVSMVVPRSNAHLLIRIFQKFGINFIHDRLVFAGMSTKKDPSCLSYSSYKFEPDPSIQEDIFPFYTNQDIARNNSPSKSKFESSFLNVLSLMEKNDFFLFSSTPFVDPCPSSTLDDSDANDKGNENDNDGDKEGDYSRFWFLSIREDESNDLNELLKSYFKIIDLSLVSQIGLIRKNSNQYILTIQLDGEISMKPPDMIFNPIKVKFNRYINSLKQSPEWIKLKGDPKNKNQLEECIIRES